MRFEIRKDGKKKYRLVRISQEEFRGGVSNIVIRNKSYTECEQRMKADMGTLRLK